MDEQGLLSLSLTESTQLGCGHQGYPSLSPCILMDNERAVR